MTIIDALKEPLFNLPIEPLDKYFKRRSLELNKEIDEPNILLLVKTILNEYKSIIENINSGLFFDTLNKYKLIIFDLCDAIFETIKLYHQGLVCKAYGIFTDAINKIDRITHYANSSEIDTRFFFRARKGNNVQYTLEEMFHVPFDKRNYASSQRFSIPGFPCLYLSDTIYGCWEELNRPPINNLMVSRFEITEANLKLLDISITANYLSLLIEAQKLEGCINETNDNLRNQVLNYFVLWSVTMVCSLKVEDIKADFKPEYIIPQFLLQWVIETNKVNGIKYLSIGSNIHFDRIIFNPVGYVSYAIPVKDTIKKKGYCDFLKKNFRHTEPISWELINITNSNLIHSSNQKSDYFKKNPLYSILPLELLNGKPSVYLDTVFGKMEIELSRMEAKNVI